MSNKYKKSSEVPTEVLLQRLAQLADAVTKDNETMCSEFTMRVPVELDRDADVVLSEIFCRFTEATAQIATLTAERDAYFDWIKEHHGSDSARNIRAYVRAKAQGNQ